MTKGFFDSRSRLGRRQPTAPRRHNLPVPPRAYEPLLEAGRRLRQSVQTSLSRTVKMRDDVHRSKPGYSMNDRSLDRDRRSIGGVQHMKSSIPSGVNEELLRAHVLLPYLRALGLSADEIQIEKRFTIKLGRRSHEVSPSTESGRADVLVRNANGDNLFIVELKNPGSTLTNDDRDQGISYARLLDQIAPFVLLSNGKESKIFDSITHQEISDSQIASPSSFYGSGRQLATPDDIRLRWEALSHFVGYSLENIQAFSKSQVQAALRPLQGCLGTDGKYDRAVYVRRQSMREAVDKFLAGPGTAFVVIGDSGVGKSNELCALAEDLSNYHIVLFLPAYTLTVGPGAALINEFNWNFAQQIEQPDLFQRLAGMGRKTERCVVVIVDGLDEATVELFPQLIGEFASQIQSTNGEIKLIASVKTTEWSRFERIRGNPSGLRMALDSSWRDDSSEQISPIVPFVLSDFSESELDQAVDKYKEKYQFESTPQGQLRIHCRVPFWLRVVSETYAGGRITLPRDITSTAIARNWLERKFSNMIDPDKARRELISLARTIHCQLTGDQNRSKTLATLQAVAEDRLPVESSSELIAQGIVNRVTDVEGRVYLSLRHSRILSYLLARHVLHMDKLSDDEFRDLLPELLSNYALEDALAWHLREGAPRHARVLAEELRGRALLYLNCYRSILERAVPGLRSRVDPRTEGDLGIAYSIFEHGLGNYGFYPMGEVINSRTSDLSSDHAGPWRDDALKFIKIGCRHVQAGGKNFANSAPDLAAAEFALEQLTTTLKSGGLDESVSSEIGVESVLAICSAYRKKLGLPVQRGHCSPFESLVPLDLRKLRASMHQWFGREFHLRKGQDSSLRRSNHQGTIPGSAETLGGYENAVARSIREVSAGVEFPPPRIWNGEDIALLPRLIDDLLAKGVLTIENSGLPLPDITPRVWSAQLPECYSDEQLVSLIQAFFLKGLAAYVALVDRNFFGIRSTFSTYSRLPCKVFAGYTRPTGPCGFRHWGQIVWGFADLDCNDDPTPDVSVNPGRCIFQRRSGPGSAWIAPNGKEVKGWSNCDLSSLYKGLSPVGRPGTSHHSDSVTSAVIRSFAYHLLLSDFESVKSGDLLAAAEDSV